MHNTDPRCSWVDFPINQLMLSPLCLYFLLCQRGNNLLKVAQALGRLWFFHRLLEARLYGLFSKIQGTKVCGRNLALILYS